MKIKVEEVHRSGKKGNPKGKTKNTSKLGTQKKIYFKGMHMCKIATIPIFIKHSVFQHCAD